MTRFHLLILPLLLLAVLPVSANAMAGLASKSSSADKSAEEEAAPEDPLGRLTPRGTVTGFLDAIGSENFDKAAQYLDLSKDPKARRSSDGAEIAKSLQVILDKSCWFYPVSMLSNHPEGKKDDEDIAADMDRIGNVRTDGKTIDILAQHVAPAGGPAIWLISSESITQLRAIEPAAVTQQESYINKILPGSLIEHKWGGAPIGHWLVAIILFALSYVSVWFVVLGVFAVLKKIWTTKYSVPGNHFLDAVRVPLSLYAAVWVYGFCSIYLDMSIIVRQHLGQLNVIVAWTALALLAWRMIDIFAETVQRRIVTNGRFFGFSSSIFFVRRMVKSILGLVIFFISLDNLGVDVTAGLAALGIGGIALALGAQKTLENFIGSLSVIIDQPVHIGDFCKVGDVSGTVEDIGMRSTRLRTNERTLVTIPNGDFSTQRIENFARRTRFLVNKKFQLRYDAKAEQIRLFCQKTQDMLFANEYVTEEGFPVRYLGPGKDGHQMELFFYIHVSENNEFLRIQQELMLKMADILSDLGMYYIIPSQTMLPAIDQLGKTENPPAPAANAP